ncbi:PRD domain-containing protein [Streptococcus parauberis]|uniref:PRD domain-containing protein n=1 Tax=Streptococcus parauberis TaxID=1348 RepID=UPI0002BBE3CE|nr:PRD domain-containing protein [Streptococcus parauberis]EMF48533.1 Beta-glucoside bgl operon antiterminator, BglG family [Streptococcus parauberis KRS-02109]UWM86730.1 PRD domain-containing protein [Streptococcus parauberis]UWM88702.1 PRD domain-containing protein [Streptococcus parauberis]WEM59484.1 PRD domain-containing protein [Streptococcus parauberis]
MLVIKQINNNAAIAKDASGTEIIILGKGVGFPKTPYEIKDMSKIERTFYDVDSQYLEMIASLPQDVLMASADIVERAEIELDSVFNTNLPFTLADHINFAIERMSKGIDIISPIAYDVKHLYPQQYSIGQVAMKIIQEATGHLLPTTEAVNVALHLITAQAESGDMHDIIQSVEIISEIRKLIEGNLNITIDDESYQFSRFVMHLRYLIKRLNAGNHSHRDSTMLKTMRREYPKEYHCVLQIRDYLKENWSWICDEEEMLYLLIYVTRLSNKT